MSVWRGETGGEHGITQRAGSDEPYILLIFSLCGPYQLLITFRAYAAYFHTYFITYFNRIDLAYSLLLIGYLSYFF